MITLFFLLKPGEQPGVVTFEGCARRGVLCAMESENGNKSIYLVCGVRALLAQTNSNSTDVEVDVDVDDGRWLTACLAYLERVLMAYFSLLHRPIYECDILNIDNSNAERD